MKLLELYQDKIMGAINGLDRIRFRGTIRWLASERGMGTFMHYAQILLKDFSGWVSGLTANVRQSCETRADEIGIEKRYLMSSGIDKEKLARQIAESSGIKEGSICMFSVLEPCIAPQVKGNKASKKLGLVMAPRKCVFVYHYFDDPEFGFGHVRIQSWVPFNVFICLNGRHWLEKQLLKNGIGYIKDGNCFPWIEDITTAQNILEGQLKSDWAGLLNRLTLDSCPALPEVLRPLRADYYWSADETEWATDIMFKSVAALDELYPSFVHHAMRVSDSPSIMHYFGRRNISLSGQIKSRAPQEVVTDCRRFYEGVRVKHWLNHNSVKMYNKSGSILRIETTVNNTRDFKVFRHPNDDEGKLASWQQMRKGVSDLHRRCEVSQKCNERYGEALATAQVNEKLKEVVADACNKVIKEGKRYRGLNPWQQDDYRMLMFLAKGENAINGFRNHDLRKWLYPESEQVGKDQQKKYSGRTTRRIKLLRAHGLVRKVSKANRYVLTEKGQKFSSAVLTASALDIKALTEMAA
jgi:hypothetical protein